MAQTATWLQPPRHCRNGIILVNNSLSWGCVSLAYIYGWLSVGCNSTRTCNKKKWPGPALRYYWLFDPVRYLYCVDCPPVLCTACVQRQATSGWIGPRSVTAWSQSAARREFPNIIVLPVRPGLLERTHPWQEPCLRELYLSLIVSCQTMLHTRSLECWNSTNSVQLPTAPLYHGRSISGYCGQPRGYRDVLTNS